MGAATGVTLNKLVQWGTKKLMAQTTKTYFYRAAGGTAKRTFWRRVGLKALNKIPVGGWVLVAWDTGTTVGMVIDNYLAREFKKYEQHCRAEFIEIEKAWGILPKSPPKLSKKEEFQFSSPPTSPPLIDTSSVPHYLHLSEYIKVRPGLMIRRPRWKFTGPPKASDFPFSYDTVPRSVRIEKKHDFVMEFGEEVLKPSDYLPFCPYLPDLNDKRSRRYLRTIEKNFIEIHNELGKLKYPGKRSLFEPSSSGLIDKLTGWGKSKMKYIETCKQTIAFNDKRLCTRWGYLKTGGTEMYFWHDRKGQSYTWAGAEGEFESEPNKAREAIDMLKKMRKTLGLS
jgi:hypothetical protein